MPQLIQGSGSNALVNSLIFGFDLDNSLIDSIRLDISANPILESSINLITEQSTILESSSELKISAETILKASQSLDINNTSGSVLSESKYYNNFSGTLASQSYTSTNAADNILSSGSITIDNLNPGQAYLGLFFSWDTSNSSINLLNSTNLIDILLSINGNVGFSFKDIANDIEKYSRTGNLSELFIPLDSSLLINGVNNFYIEAIYSNSNNATIYLGNNQNGDLAIELFPPREASIDIDRLGNSAKLSGTISVFTPADLSATITITSPQEISGTISVYSSANSFLSGSIAVFSQYINYLPASINTVVAAEMSGTITVVRPTDLSGTISVKQENDLSGTLIVTSPYLLSGTLNTVTPNYISGTINVVRPSDLSGTITVTPNRFTSDLSGTLEVFNENQRDLSGTITVKSRSDLDGSVTTERPLIYLMGSVTVGEKFVHELSGTINIFTPADLTSQLITERPHSDISGSVSINPYINLSGSLEVAPLTSDLSGTISVNFNNNNYLSGTLTTDKFTHDLSGTISVVNNTRLLSGTITTEPVEIFSKSLNSAIIVSNSAKFKYLNSRINIFPYAEISGSLHVIRPSHEVSGTLEVKSKFEGNVAQEFFYSYDNFSYSVKDLTLVSGSGTLEQFNISISDISGSESFNLIPHVRVTGTDTISIKADDSFHWQMNSEETAAWAYPIQLTDNIFPENVYSLPSITSFDNKVYLSYSQNYNNQLKRVYVVNSEKLQMTSDEKWTISNLYTNEFAGQFAGPDGQLIINRAEGWIQHPGPQHEEANDFFKIDIQFIPESYDQDEDVFQNMWDTIQYVMQREGIIQYPPPQWGFNPLSEVISGPTDPFDPLPKESTFIPSNLGYMQFFGNFFAGNGD